MDIGTLSPLAIGIIGLALFLGGLLKGAIGMGAPVVAIPVMASFVDVRLAVVVMVVPNLLTTFGKCGPFDKAGLAGNFQWLMRVLVRSALQSEVLFWCPYPRHRLRSSSPLR